MTRLNIFLLLLIAFADSSAAGAAKIVIAHRGASGYLPEHTLAAYAMAYSMGADYIEPDVVMTRDGELIALHDIHLELTTDVAIVFPGRVRTDGHWYAADLNLAEIKQLQAHERSDKDGNAAFPERFKMNAGGFQVPTLREVIELVQELNRITGCHVGLYPETKQPKFHDEENLPLEQTLLNLLAEYGYSGRDARIFIQSFDPDNLKEMRFELKTELPLIQLISGNKTQDAMVTAAGLDEIATYANGIGPSKKRIEENPGLVTMAHERGLVVHPWTFRADEIGDGYDSFTAELQQFYQHYDVDGVFTDHTNLAVSVIKPEFRKPVAETAGCRL
jgi:glycerophosphoryl diester phosphodiesterase